MIDLEDLGWGVEWQASFGAAHEQQGLVPARVSAERRGAYDVVCAAGELQVDLAGRLSYMAAGPEELPAVGDWVLVAPRPEERAGTIQELLPRRTSLVRREPLQPARAQVLAANIDAVLVVSSANRNFRPRRIERVLALVAESGAEGIVVLSKLDLCSERAPLLAEAEAAAGGRTVVALSSLTGEGLGALAPHVRAGRTLALLGSSGVGKSTLANRLLGREALITKEIRSDDKGRHATTHRQLLVLPAGGILIDTPGLREIGLWDDSGDALASAFPEIEELAAQCRFPDCGHGNEPGCAIHAALEDGSLTQDRLDSFHKLERELLHVRTRRDARARHERRKHMKRFAKQIRNRPDKRSRR